MQAGYAAGGQPQPEISIQQITLALVEHPAVAEVSVVPCHQADRPPEIVAFVVPRGNSADLEHALLEHARQRFGRALVHKVVFLDALPRSPTGKVDRRRLEAGDFLT